MTQDEIPPPSLRLWIWTIVMALLSSLEIAATLYEAISTRTLDASVPLGPWFGVWLIVVIRTIKRQDLTPSWFWAFAGATSGLLVIVPLWHHGREWKSTWRKWAGWTWFVLTVILVVLSVARH